MNKQLLYLFGQICIVIIFLGCSDKNAASDEITIYGNVIDRVTGHPLYNVLIQEKNKIGGSTVTGNDGNYEFTLPVNESSEKKYYLVASKDKYSSSEYELVMNNVDENRRVKVDFQLSKNALIYTGKVMNELEQPIYDARVDYYRGTNGVALFSTSYTDVEGTYTIELDDWYTKNWTYSIKIEASKNGYSTDVFTGVQQENQMGIVKTINFHLIKE